MPDYLTLEEIVSLHDQIIAKYGGDLGTLDASGIESAANAARNYFEYELGAPRKLDEKILAALAGCYWYHLTRNHGFVDGNKRIGYSAAKLFLIRNGYSMKMPHGKAERVSRAIATGTLSREGVMLAIWPSLAA